MNEKNFKFQRNPAKSFFRNYLKYLGMFFLIYIVFASTVNLTVDPMGYYFLTTHKFFNEFKPLSHGSRVQKSLLLKNGDFDAIIAGTSRAQVGIDPDHPKLSEYKTFNLSLISSNIFEINKVLQFTQKHQDIKLLIWGMDLFAFNANVFTQRDFNLSLFADENNIYRIYSGYLMSFKTLKNSFKTVKLNFLGNSISSYTRADGFRFISPETRIQPRQTFRRTMKADFLGNENTYSGFAYDDLRVSLIRETLEQYSKNGARIILFISPIHAWQLELIHQVGLFEHYKQMKRDLLKMVSRFNAEHKSSSQISLWDFGTYHPITTEKIPPEDDPKTQMNWFWESSHFKKELGDKILDLILEPADVYQKRPDFGVLLTQQNIENELAELDRKKLKYRKEYPEEVREISQLINETIKR